MFKPIYAAVCSMITAAMMIPAAFAADSPVPEPFQRFNPDSRYSISYADLNGVLKKVVVDTGRSTREKSAPIRAKTGSRLKVNVKRSTTNEGNRFYYEVFSGDADTTQMLLNIQKNLEGVPAEAPLEYFSRDEQLAYWLNLYNVTLINEIISIYPKRKLKKLLTGRKSILKKKLLNVAGVPLSLDDIQYTILRHNYGNDPLVLYGLYQGIIGGPNIRKSAYTAANVRRHLAENAAEFVNSNRGTYAKDEKVFRVSSLYDRNRSFFPNFQADLKTHLLSLLEGRVRGQLQAATTIKPDINDWTITDLYGSYPELGGSLADNSAALLDSVKATTQGSDGPGSSVSSGFSAVSSGLISKSSSRSYVSPELLVYLKEIKAKQDAINMEKGTVTVEELGEVPVDQQAETAAEPGSGEERKD
ncbi:MAG: DUF547 domain-containing protein [Xanthomonadales bacterium]|nr:DUF547 domain-containing protein [Gammaproteobacteria bacterium]MBT8054742.1 DUF547 domain-containing protein [Gammaproteobacteria bacterium]NND58535.1 DUF547 domain-containing protein [Xanthomonadales bacterium]NNK52229.1 DUF547 domain-containing protein [Xanthomonadales bacterium]